MSTATTGGRLTGQLTCDALGSSREREISAGFLRRCGWDLAATEISCKEINGINHIMSTTPMHSHAGSDSVPLATLSAQGGRPGHLIKVRRSNKPVLSHTQKKRKIMVGNLVNNKNSQCFSVVKRLQLSQEFQSERSRQGKLFDWCATMGSKIKEEKQKGISPPREGVVSTCFTSR